MYKKKFHKLLMLNVREYFLLIQKINMDIVDPFLYLLDDHFYLYLFRFLQYFIYDRKMI